MHLHQFAHSTPLMVASENGHLAVVRALLLTRADANQARAVSRAGLLGSLRIGYLGIVAMLLRSTLLCPPE